MADTDVLKMKVADLKRELKLRGLPITGNKTELQERLQSVLLEGDLSLEDTAMSEDVLLDEEDVLTDEEVPVSPSPEAISDQKGLEKTGDNISAPLTEIKSDIESNLQKKPVVLKRKPITLSLSNSSDEGQSSSVLTPEEPAIKTSKLVEIKPSENDTENLQEDKRVVKVTQLTMKERLELRAKKFGGGLVSTPNATSNSNENKKISQEIIDHSDPKTIEALKKRAERFGIVTAPQISAIEKAEKLQKRKERFGLNEDTANKSTNSATAPTSNIDYAEKARLRLERFKTATAN